MNKTNQNAILACLLLLVAGTLPSASAAPFYADLGFEGWDFSDNTYTSSKKQVESTQCKVEGSTDSSACRGGDGGSGGRGGDGGDGCRDSNINIGDGNCRGGDGGDGGDDGDGGEGGKDGNGGDGGEDGEN